MNEFICPIHVDETCPEDCWAKQGGYDEATLKEAAERYQREAVNRTPEDREAALEVLSKREPKLWKSLDEMSAEFRAETQEEHEERINHFRESLDAKRKSFDELRAEMSAEWEEEDQKEQADRYLEAMNRRLLPEEIEEIKQRFRNEQGEKSMGRKRHVALANERGVVNLGSYYSGVYFDLTHNEDGTITLTPVKVYPASEIPALVEEEIQKRQQEGN